MGGRFHFIRNLDMPTMTTKSAGRLSVAVLKWLAAPLLVFLLAGLVTKRFVRAERGGEEQGFQQTMDSSLQKLDSGDRAGVVAGLARAGEMATGNASRQAALIPKFIALGEHKLAGEAIERSLRGAAAERQTAIAYAGLCEYFLDHDDVANAKRILTGDLIVRWPDASRTLFLQGKLALQGVSGSDEFEAAAALFQKCLELDRGDMPAMLHLGITDSRLGRLDQAESHFRAVLEKRPFDALALDQLGGVLRQQGKAAEAAKFQEEHRRVSGLQERRKQLEGRYSLKKYQPADLLELSRIYDQLEEFAKVVSTLRIYTHAQPDDADSKRELARARLKIDAR